MPYIPCMQPWRSVLTQDKMHRLVLTMQEDNLAQMARWARCLNPKKAYPPHLMVASGVVLLCTELFFLAVPTFQLHPVPVILLCYRSTAPPVLGPGLKTLLRFCFSLWNL